MDDFDRSFEYFEQQSSLRPFHSKTDTATNRSGEEENDFDPAFSSDAFSFSATFSHEATDREIFHAEASESVNAFRSEEENQAQIRIREQVSALYDDFSQDGAISVTGTIYLQTPLQSLRLDLKNTKYIQRIEEIADVSQVLQRGNDITARGLKVALPEEGMATLTEIPIAHFYCIAKARPVPLLVKRKINVLDGFVRVGFKVRTNPHNQNSLQSIYIVMAVPPDVEGEKCKMSVKGGSWNEMKRTLTWLVKDLAPGKALEIQAQFPSVDNAANYSTPKFPILVKATYTGLYSELSVESADETCDLKVRTSTCLLHRKV